MVMQYKWIAVLHEMFDKVNFYICFFIRCLCHTLCYPLCCPFLRLLPYFAKSPRDPCPSKAVSLSCLPCALLKSARYQLVIVEIVDNSAENCRNVIIAVSFSSPFPYFLEIRYCSVGNVVKFSRSHVFFKLLVPF